MTEETNFSSKFILEQRELVVMLFGDPVFPFSDDMEIVKIGKKYYPAALDEIERLKQKVQILNDKCSKINGFLKKECIEKPTDNWQWGYRAAILAIADLLLFAQTEPQREVKDENAGGV